MQTVPALALATTAGERDPSPGVLAILAGLRYAALRVQLFRSRAHPLNTTRVNQLAGMPCRHLDSWLMPPALCRQILDHGCAQADLVIVAGALDEAESPTSADTWDAPGRLDDLVETLDLPVIALLPCSSLADLRLPRLHPRVRGLILDGLVGKHQFLTIKTVVEQALKRPVLGAIHDMPATRRRLAETAPQEPLDPEVVDQMARSFLGHVDVGLLRDLGRPLRPLTRPALTSTPRRFRVAYAMDDAFGAYFPDTLETLEGLGAELVDFSPLRDESLPRDIDLVIIGCGSPERHLAELVQNVSLHASLRHHVCRGKRIYAEGGGMAYLSRSMIVDGVRYPSAGILANDAVLRATPCRPRPVTRILNRDSWLGVRGTPIRGYRSDRWELHPAPDPGDCPARSGGLTSEQDLVFRHHAIGSLVHLHLGALPEVVRAFAQPHQESLSLPRIVTRTSPI